MRRPGRWIAAGFGLFVVLLIAAVVILAVVAPPKSFTLPRVAVDATLRPDGSLRIRERITYRFTGSFSYGTRPIPVGAYTITDMTVTERGRRLPTSGEPHNLQWWFSAQDEERTFTIAYTVTGAARAGPDVAEVYWKWVGEDHPTIGLVTARLRVPAGPGRLRAWGHGPLAGTVGVADELVRWRAPQVRPGTFVEGRVAVPAARVPGLPREPEPRLLRILAEERAWAEAANEQRARDRREAAAARRDRRASGVLAPIVTLVAATGYLWLWRRTGREPARPGDVGEYRRELPDDPPAVVDALARWGSVGASAFTGTVLDLARRGYLTITAEHRDRPFLPDTLDHVLRRTGRPADDLAPFERTALELLFADGSEVRQSELVARGRADQANTTKRWQRFRREVEQELRTRRYLQGGRAAPFAANLGLAAAAAGAGLLAVDNRATLPGAVALVWAAVQVALTATLRQRTPAGNRRYHEWSAVRRFLRDVSNLQEAPVGHLVLWERYLVYAVVLGVADQVIRALALRVPEAVHTGAVAGWYRADGTGFDLRGFSTFGSTLGSTVSTAATPPSSGSGSGGGFSGGGGGGGGGGGIGAG